MLFPVSQANYATKIHPEPARGAAPLRGGIIRIHVGGSAGNIDDNRCNRGNDNPVINAEYAATGI